jgi:RHS repeat-associated protein
MLKKSLLVSLLLTSNISLSATCDDIPFITELVDRSCGGQQISLDGCGGVPDYLQSSYPDKFLKDDYWYIEYDMVWPRCKAISCTGARLPYFDRIFSGAYSFPASCLEQLPPKDPPEKESIDNQCSSTASGSIIVTSNQVVGETISLVGVPFTLNHFSNWSAGRLSEYTTKYGVQSSAENPNLNGTQITIIEKLISGDVLWDQKSFDTSSNQTYKFTWNGKEQNGSQAWSSKKFKLIYKTLLTNNTTKTEEYDLILGSLQAQKVGLGGWLPSLYHFYDSTSEKLISADGNFRKVRFVQEGNLKRVPSSSGQEVYYFDQLGRILQTKSGLTGAVLYSFHYHPINNKLTSITNSFNQEYKFIYDVNGNIKEIISFDGSVTRLTTNEFGFIASVKNPKNETYLIDYLNSHGLIHKFTRPNGNWAIFTYDESGNLIKDQNASGQVSELMRALNSVKLTTAMGRVTEFSFDSKKNESIKINPSGFKVTSIFNDNEVKTESLISVVRSDLENDPRFGDQVKNYKTTTTSGFGSSQTNEENAVVLQDPADIFSINSLSKTITNGDNVVNYVYDGLTRTSIATTSLGRSVATQIDELERPILEQTGELAPIRYFYSQELLSKIKHEEREINLKYHPQTRLLIESKNSLGQSTKYSYDEAQRLKSQTLPDGRVVQYQYDFQGNLVSLTPPSRPAHTQVYGQNDRLQSYNPPALVGVSNVNTTYSYNLDRDLTRITRPDGQEINFNYGQTSGLLDSMTGSFGAISRVYENEQVKKISDQAGRSIVLNYIGSRVSSITEKNAQNQVVSTYSRTPKENSNGLVASETVSAGNKSITVDYDYDADKFLTKAEDLELAYNSPNGSLKETKLKNIKEEYFYNKFGEVKGFRACYLEGTEQKLLYSYELKRDKIGRIVKKIETFGKRELKAKHKKGRFFRFHENYCHAHKKDHKLESEYIYDKAGRLIKVENKHGRDSVYIYDQNSNRIAGFSDDGRIEAVYDNQDRLIRYNDSVFSYNPNGDLLSEAKRIKKNYQTTNFNYDVFGQLRLAGNVSFDTNLLQLRSTKKLNGQIAASYIYDAQKRLIGEISADGNLKKRFVFASKSHSPDYFIDEELNSYKIITDHLGSVRLVVNAESGEIVQKMLHDVFGVVTENTNPGFVPFGFAGGIYDHETGLVRFGARDYNPKIGRWTSKDPIRFEGGDSNLYGYVIQDPVNFIDDTGLNRQNPSSQRSPFSPGGGISSGGGGIGGGSGGGNGNGIGSIGVIAIGAAIGGAAKSCSVYKDIKRTEKMVETVKKAAWCVVSPENCNGKTPEDVAYGEDVLKENK